MEETQYFKFPLPDPLNYADEDAERIKEALIKVDALLQDVKEHVDCDDPLLDTLQKIADAIALVENGKAAVEDFEAFQDVVDEALRTVRGAVDALEVNRHVPLPPPAEAQPSETAFRLPAGTESGEGADVAGLGRFCWSPLSTDPGDGETCLLAEGLDADRQGRWLLVEPDWTAVLSEVLRLVDELEFDFDATRAATEARFARELEGVGYVRTARASLKFGSVPAYGGTQDMIVKVSGVSVGDAVSVTCATLATGLFVQGFVNEEGEVTVRLMNAKNGAVTPVTADYLITAVGASRGEG